MTGGKKQVRPVTIQVGSTTATEIENTPLPVWAWSARTTSLAQRDSDCLVLKPNLVSRLFASVFVLLGTAGFVVLGVHRQEMAQQAGTSWLPVLFLLVPLLFLA